MLYRVRTSLAYRYFQLKTRGLDHTPPLVSDTHSPCEVHTMLGANDVTMYILAIKSLLSYVPTLSVVVHSDGSLTPRTLERLQAHVRELRFVWHQQADERARTQLAHSPFLQEWRGVDAAYRRLIDIELWRAAEKVIILDSDVLTSRKPQEVVDWIRSGQRPFMLGQPPKGWAPAPGPGVKEHVQAQFLRQVPAINAATGNSGVFMQGGTAGFCGYSREISLPRIEAALKAALALGLPMTQWGGDQCLIIYLISMAEGQRLPTDRYLNFDPSLRGAAADANMIHFFGTYRFHGLVFPRLAAAVVKRLNPAAG